MLLTKLLTKRLILVFNEKSAKIKMFCWLGGFVLSSLPILSKELGLVIANSGLAGKWWNVLSGAEVTFICISLIVIVVQDLITEKKGTAPIWLSFAVLLVFGCFLYSTIVLVRELANDFNVIIAALCNIILLIIVLVMGISQYASYIKESD